MNSHYILKYFRVLAITSPLVLIVLFGGVTGDSVDENRERAQRAAQAFMEQLQGVLIAELRGGGPVQALAVCADTAQSLTRIAERELGVSLKRISDRLRNPLNSPDPYEQEVFSSFKILQQEGQEPPFVHWEVRTLNGEKEFWYFQSIHLQAQCLGCHGAEDRIADNVRELIREKYPTDAATGYEVGDLRGAIRVSFPIDD